MIAKDNCSIDGLLSLHMKERKSNIELLRCLLMFMVVVIHFLGHNILDKSNPVQIGEPNFISSNILFSFVVCAVDCFVIISGYFSVYLTVGKLFRFLAPICFYQFIFSFIYFALGIHHRLSIDPFCYGFVVPYTMLLLVSPIFNEGLKRINKKQLQIILFFCTVFFMLPIRSVLGQAGRCFGIFVFLYLIGCYIRKYNKSKANSCIVSFLLYFFVVLLIFIETYLLAYYDRNLGTIALSYNYDNILVILSAVYLFQTFRHFYIKSKFINRLASSAFFVYIIHENENLRGKHGIYDLLHVNDWSSLPSLAFIILIFISSISVFFLSIGIDNIRKIIFGRFEDRIVKWLYVKIDKKVFC